MDTQSATTLVCSECGSEAHATCDCNSVYARKARVVETIKKNFKKSDRAIAGIAGTSPTTIGKVRQELQSSGQLPALKKRKGKDGKVRKLPKMVEPDQPTLTKDDESGLEALRAWRTQHRSRMSTIGLFEARLILTGDA